VIPHPRRGNRDVKQNLKTLVTIVIPRSARDFRKSALFFALALSLLSGCGVPGAPLPPSLDIPKFVGDLKAVRKGETVTLTWTTPTETTDGELVRKPGKMLVQRALSTGKDSTLDFKTIAELPLPPALKDNHGNTASAKDSLADLLHSGTSANFVVYSVLAQGRNGKSSGLPNRVSVPLVVTSPPPQKVEAVPVMEGVRVTWDRTPPPQAESRLSTQYAYRIMREPAGANEPVLVKQLSSNETSFVDTGIEWEKNYQYWVTPVTLWQEGNRKGEVMGDDSPVVSVLAHDSFPPAVPSGLQAVFTPLSQNSFIDLTWTPNTDNDLAGYNVYRRSGNGLPAKINSELIKTPRFADPAIQPGMKYFYSVTAVDLRGNESGKSEETSETVPTQ